MGFYTSHFLLELETHFNVSVLIINPLKNQLNRIGPFFSVVVSTLKGSLRMSLEHFIIEPPIDNL